ncbi:Cytochrome P450 78A11 [Acorus calamus]|uniref:Cytochrome P450 78A11 n=1 Tax=Acorus calamus TaxID=4465 RepID=A0AAV9CK96_ACOCL|nr:Cytochrome P450 78A11 [Acorus calamus]
MEFNVGLGSKDTTWWVFTLPAFLGAEAICDGFIIASLFVAAISAVFLAWALSNGGFAWKNGRTRFGPVPIPGPKGLPFFGSLFSLTSGLAHRTLDSMARGMAATKLMAFSIGSTPFVVSSDPSIAREILSSPHFADRPLKKSARELMFSRAIGFAPSGSYWRLLRRIAASHLFAPRRVAAHELGRQADCEAMLGAVADEQSATGSVGLRKHLQDAALNNIMGSVFGRRYDYLDAESAESAGELKEMVREGFELLGAFNWSDHLPWLGNLFDPLRVNERCARLVPRVRGFVIGVIEEHRKAREGENSVADNADFVDVLLSLEGEEKLHENDMVAVLWEMIFRGTDTTALLTEWAMAELVFNPDVQKKLQKEIESVVGAADRDITDADVARMPYLQAVIKETLRAHPPGPLLSWARLSTSDVQLSNGMVVPAHTTTMVNMWSITHDPAVWSDPTRFDPDRFMHGGEGADVDVRGGDTRLAPFGAGRRVCPGKNLGLVSVGLWVAKLVHRFEWGPAEEAPVDLSEVLKLSCEMKNPLFAVAKARAVAGAVGSY